MSNSDRGDLEAGAVRTNNSDNSTNDNNGRSQRIMAAMYHGPMPLPQHLEEYERIHPGTAERMLALAEREAEHIHRMEERAQQAMISEVRIGQIFALIIGLTTIIAGALTAISGHEWSGSIIGTAGVIGLVTVFIKGRSGSKNEG